MAGSDTSDVFVSESTGVGVAAGIVSQLNLVDLAGSGAWQARESTHFQTDIQWNRECALFATNRADCGAPF